MFLLIIVSPQDLFARARLFLRHPFVLERLKEEGCFEETIQQDPNYEGGISVHPVPAQTGKFFGKVVYGCDQVLVLDIMYKEPRITCGTRWNPENNTAQAFWAVNHCNYVSAQNPFTTATTYKGMALLTERGFEQASSETITRPVARDASEADITKMPPVSEKIPPFEMAEFICRSHINLISGMIEGKDLNS